MPHAIRKSTLALSVLLFWQCAEAQNTSPQIKSSWRPAEGKACTDDPFYAADGKTCDDYFKKTCGNPDGDNTKLTVFQRNLLAACPDSCLDGEYCTISQISFATMTVNYPSSTAPDAADYFVDDFMEQGGFVANNESATVQLLELVDENMDTIDGHTRFLNAGDYPSVIIGPGDADLLRKVADIVQESNETTLVLSTFIGDETIFSAYPMLYGFIRPYPRLLQPVFQLLAKEQSGAYVSMVCPSADRKLTRNFRICAVMRSTIEDNNLLLLNESTITSFDSDFLVDQDYSKTSEISDSVRDFAENLTRPRPDIILCLDNSTACLHVVFALRQIDYSPPLAIVLVDDGTLDYFIDAVEQPDSYWKSSAGVKRLAAAELLQDVLLISDWDRSGYDPTITGPNLTTLEVVEFNALFYARANYYPTFESASTFVAMSAVMQAYQNASNDPRIDEPRIPMDVLATYLDYVEGDSFYGYVKFDQNGQIATHASTMQVDVQREGVVPRVKMRVVTPKRKATEDPIIPFPHWDEKSCSQSVIYQRGSQFFCINAAGECKQCDDGYTRKMNNATGRFDCTICPPGTLQWFTGPKQEPICEPCSAGEYNDRPGIKETAGSQRCNQCTAGRFSLNPGSWKCSDCPAGRHAGADGSTSCLACLPMLNADGQIVYSYSAPASAVCTPCPIGGVCEPDSNNLVTNFTSGDGYFLDSRMELVACIHGDGAACLKRGRCYTDEKGFQTMSGPYCGSCEPGYSRYYPSDLCDQCPSQAESVGGVFVQLLALLLVPSILMVVSLLTDFNQPADIILPVLKQFVNHVSMVSVVALSSGSTSIVSKSSIIFVYGERLLGLSEMGTPLSGLAPSCLMQYLNPDIQFYKVEIVLAFLWLPLNVIGALMFASIYNALAYLFRGRLIERQHLVLWFTINVFCFLPRITTLITRAWDCQFFDTYRLLWNPKILCESNVWSSIGTVGVFLISFGLPVLLFLLLHRFRRVDRLKSPEVATMLGFLYSGFESDRYYFECIFLLRKVLYRILTKIPGLGAAQFADTDRNYGTTILVLATFCYGFHSATAPFDNRAYFLLDRIEKASGQAIVVMAVLQAWALSTEKAQTWRNSATGLNLRDACCLIIIMACHVRFLALVLWGLLRPVLLKRIESRRKQGSIEVRRDGFLFFSLQAEEQTLVETFFADMAALHVRITQRFTIGEVLASLQHISLECDKVHQLRNLVHARNVLRHYVPRLARTRTFTAEEVSESETLGGQTEKKRWLDMQIKALQSGQATLTEENLAKTVGKKFRTDEMYNALLRLGTDICKDKIPVELPAESVVPGDKMQLTWNIELPAAAIDAEMEGILIGDEDAQSEIVRGPTVTSTEDACANDFRMQLLMLREKLEKAQGVLKELQESSRKQAALYKERQASATDSFTCGPSEAPSRSRMPSQSQGLTSFTKSSQPQEVSLDDPVKPEDPKVDSRSPTDIQVEELTSLKAKLQAKQTEAETARVKLQDLTGESHHLQEQVKRYPSTETEVSQDQEPSKKDDTEYHSC